jgi:hypothetical protein
MVYVLIPRLTRVYLFYYKNTAASNAATKLTPATPPFPAVAELGAPVDAALPEELAPIDADVGVNCGNVVESTAVVEATETSCPIPPP